MMSYSDSDRRDELDEERAYYEQQKAEELAREQWDEFVHDFNGKRWEIDRYTTILAQVEDWSNQYPELVLLGEMVDTLRGEIDNLEEEVSDLVEPATPHPDYPGYTTTSQGLCTQVDPPMPGLLDWQADPLITEGEIYIHSLPSSMEASRLYTGSPIVRLSEAELVSLYPDRQGKALEVADVIAAYKKVIDGNIKEFSISLSMPNCSEMLSEGDLIVCDRDSVTQSQAQSINTACDCGKEKHGFTSHVRGCPADV